MHRILAATLGAALATSLLPAAPASAAPRTVAIDPGGAPRGAAPRGDWLDPERQVVHSDGKRVAVTPRLAVPLVRVQRARGGWVAAARGVNKTRIIRIRRDGTWTVLVEEPDTPGGALVLDYRVSPHGGKLAYTYVDDDAEHAAVLRIGDGTEVDRVDADRVAVLDYADNSKVYLSLDAGGPGPGTSLAVWKPGTDPVVRPEERLRRLDGLDVHTGVAWRESRRSVEVVPLEDGGWTAWRRPGQRVDGVTTDGRYVLTYTQLDRSADRYPYPGRLVVRDARTGDPVRVFSGFPQSGAVDGPVWESRRRVLAPVHDRSGRITLVRLHVRGRVERLAPFRSIRHDQPAVVPIR